MLRELTMLKRIFILIAILVITNLLNAQIAYLDGFNSSMTFNEVMTNIQYRGLKINTPTGVDSIYATTHSIHGILLVYEFHFCNNELVSFRKDFEPSMQNFINVFDDLASKYGNMIIGYSNINFTSSVGERREIALKWILQNLEIELSYTIYEINDALTVRFYKKNNCDK